MSPSPLACTCAPLAEPLVDQTVDDFDHICGETMRANVLAAIRDGVLPPSEIWPIPSSGRRKLGFVIRQWVQTTPDRTLVNVLTTSPSWRREVLALLQLYDIWRSRNPGQGIGQWALRHTAGRSARRLDEAGLPSSPATMRHLHAVVAELGTRIRMDERLWRDAHGLLDLSKERLADLAQAQPSWMPSRGLLITTLVYVKITPRMTVVLDSKGSEVAISGPLEFTTGPLLELARGEVLRQRNWLRRWAQNPLTHISTIRRSQPHSWSHQAHEQSTDRFDYLREALEGVDTVRLQARTHHLGVQGAISDHLKAVNKRVAARRRASGLATTPPPGWTKTARHQLLLLLK